MVKSFITRDLYRVRTKAQSAPLYVAADGIREVLDIIGMAQRNVTILEVVKTKDRVYIQDRKDGTRSGEAE